MRTFQLRRQEDISGISGVGIVAEGVEFSDGRVVLRWVVGDARSISVWDDLDSMQAIHGHGGATLIEWTGDPS